VVDEPVSKPNIDIGVMLKKLDEMYEKEEDIISQIDKLYLQYQQIQGDKELLQTMIMHQSNKSSLFNDWLKKTGRNEP